MACYPNSLFAPTVKVDNVNEVLSAHMNAVQDEIVALETLLGIAPAAGAVLVGNDASPLTKVAAVALGSYLASAGENIPPVWAILNQAAVAGLKTSDSPTFAGVTAPLNGNAASATKLLTARAINGVDFDGTGPITVTADANTLSGTTLKSTVLISSLTSVGVLAGVVIAYASAVSLKQSGGSVYVALQMGGDNRTQLCGSPSGIDFMTSSGSIIGIWVNGLQVGATPAGGDKGSGTVNVAGDIYKNGTAYNNPAYVFERYYTNKIVRFADRPGAAQYEGLRPLADVEAFASQHFDLPLMAQNPNGGLFDRGELLQATVEEAYLYLMDHERRLKVLEVKPS